MEDNMPAKKRSRGATKVGQQYMVSTRDDLKGSKDYSTLIGAERGAVKMAKESPGGVAYIHDWGAEGSHNYIIASAEENTVYYRDGREVKLPKAKSRKRKV